MFRPADLALSARFDKGMIRSQTPALGDDPKMLTEKYWREMIETLTSEPDPTAKKHTPAHTAAVRKPAN